MVTIDQLSDMAINISGEKLIKKHITGPLDVRGRNSNNNLIYERLGWKPAESLEEGLRKTYAWIEEQVRKKGVTPIFE